MASSRGAWAECNQPPYDCVALPRCSGRLDGRGKLPRKTQRRRAMLLLMAVGAALGRGDEATLGDLVSLVFNVE